LPINHLARVTLYHAANCHLCERALEVVREVQVEFAFELELIDVGGDPELEAQYREHLPVVEVDGDRVFTYFVDAEALRRRLSR
jgi:glutaredoxin